MVMMAQCMALLVLCLDLMALCWCVTVLCLDLMYLCTDRVDLVQVLMDRVVLVPFRHIMKVLCMAQVGQCLDLMVPCRAKSVQCLASMATVAPCRASADHRCMVRDVQCRVLRVSVVLCPNLTCPCMPMVVQWVRVAPTCLATVVLIHDMAGQCQTTVGALCLDVMAVRQ